MEPRHDRDKDLNTRLNFLSVLIKEQIYVNETISEYFQNKNVKGRKKQARIIHHRCFGLNLEKNRMECHEYLVEKNELVGSHLCSPEYLLSNTEREERSKSRDLHLAPSCSTGNSFNTWFFNRHI